MFAALDRISVAERAKDANKPPYKPELAAKVKDLEVRQSQEDPALTPTALPFNRSVPGVVEVNTWGGEQRVLEVKVDPMRLAARGLAALHSALLLAHYGLEDHDRVVHQHAHRERDAAEAHAAATEKMTARERGKIGGGRWHGHSRVMVSSRFSSMFATSVYAASSAGGVCVFGFDSPCAIARCVVSRPR